MLVHCVAHRKTVRYGLVNSTLRALNSQMKGASIASHWTASATKYVRSLCLLCPFHEPMYAWTYFCIHKNAFTKMHV